MVRRVLTGRSGSIVAMTRRRFLPLNWNIHQLPQFVNVKFAGRSRPVWRVISLMNGGLFRAPIAKFRRIELYGASKRSHVNVTPLAVQTWTCFEGKVTGGTLGTQFLESPYRR